MEFLLTKQTKKKPKKIQQKRITKNLKKLEVK